MIYRDNKESNTEERLTKIEVNTITINPKQYHL